MLNVLSLIYIHDYLNHLNTTLVNVKQFNIDEKIVVFRYLNTTLVNVKRIEEKDLGVITSI